MAKKIEEVLPRYKPGDRVAERPKNSAMISVREESVATVKKYSSQRYGVVVSSVIKEIKASKRNTRQIYVDVIWDGHNSSSRHAQMRLCYEHELQKLQETFSLV